MNQARCEMFLMIAGEFEGCCSLGAILLATLGEGRCRTAETNDLLEALRSFHPELTSIENGAALLNHFNVHVENRGVIPKSLEWAIVYLNDEKFLPAAQIADALGAIGV